MPLACPLQTRKPEARATLRKFPPVPAPIPHLSIRRTENISPGARKRAPVSKPINGGCSCKIDDQETHSIGRRSLIDRLEASRGHRILRESSSLSKTAATHASQ